MAVWIETLRLDNTLVVKRLFWRGFYPRRPRDSALTRLTNLSSDLGSAQSWEVKTVFLKGFLICRPRTIGLRSPAAAFHLWPPAHLTPPHAPLRFPGTHWCGSPVRRILGRIRNETSSHRRRRCRHCSCRKEAGRKTWGTAAAADRWVCKQSNECVNEQDTFVKFLGEALSVCRPQVFIFWGFTSN